MNKLIYKQLSKYVIVVTLLMILVVSSVFHHNYEKQQRADVKEELLFLIEESTDGKAINSLERITVMDEAGNVQYDNTYDVNKIKNQSDKKEVLDALEYQEGYAIRYSEQDDAMYLYYARKLANQSLMRISTSYLSLSTYLVSILPFSIFLIITNLVLLYIVVNRTSKKLANSINRIDVRAETNQEILSGLEPLALKIMMYNDDIKEKKIQQLKHSENFEKTLALINEGFIIVDENNFIVSLNEAAELALGATNIKKGVHLLIYNRNPILIEGLERVEKGYDYTNVLQIEDQHYRLIMNRLGSDEYGGAIIVLLNVTHQKQYEQLEKEFSANVSHELKTPLTSILGTSEMLQKGMIKPEDQAHFINNIHSEAQNMLDLVSDIIKVSRLDEKKVAHAKESFNLKHLIEEILNKKMNHSGKEEFQIIKELEPIRITALKSVVRDVIDNAIENAVLYNNDEKTIIIKLYREEHKTIMSVYNTGKNIENTEKIFDRFYRESTQDVKGSGLGMSIIKNGMLLNDGEVKVINHPEGVELILYFNE